MVCQSSQLTVQIFKFKFIIKMSRRGPRTEKTRKNMIIRVTEEQQSQPQSKVIEQAQSNACLQIKNRREQSVIISPSKHELGDRSGAKKKFSKISDSYKKKINNYLQANIEEQDDKQKNEKVLEVQLYQEEDYQPELIYNEQKVQQIKEPREALQVEDLGEKMSSGDQQQRKQVREEQNKTPTEAVSQPNNQKEYKNTESIYENSADLDQTKRKAIFGIIIFAVLSAVISGLLWLTIRPQKSNNFSGLTLLDSLIVNRTFQEGQVFYYAFNISTKANSSLVVAQYTFLVAVNNCSENGTNFLAVLQKRKEILYNQKGVIERQQQFDKSNTYMQILKNGVDSVKSSIDANVNRTQNYPQPQFNNSSNETFVKQTQVLPIFRFNLNKNGKISNVTFHKQNDKATLGLAKSFIKIFSPYLDKQTYIKAKFINKTKQSKQNKQVLENGNTNTTDSEQTNQKVRQSRYSESQKHRFETEQSEIILHIDSNVNYSGPTHITFEKTYQVNTFSKDGKLIRVFIESNTKYKSMDQQPSSSFQVLNMGINQQTNQTAHMNIVQYFKTPIKNIQGLGNLMTQYEVDNKTLTLSVQNYINFILGASNPSNSMKPGETRLLQQNNGELKILSHDKQHKIMSTNILGLDVSAHFYTLVRIFVTQDPQNPLRKMPKIEAGAGIQLAFGFLKDKAPVLDYNKRLEPISLKLTLDKINDVMNLVKGGFIGKVLSLAKTILNGQFEQKILPNTINLLASTLQLSQGINLEILNNSPNSTMSKILNEVKEIHNRLSMKGTEMLNKKNQFVKNLTGSLQSFLNTSLQQAIQEFNKVKNIVLSFKNEGIKYLSSALGWFQTKGVQKVKSQLAKLIPAQVYSDYKKEIQKAKEITDLISFVKQKGGQYSAYLNSATNTHQKNIIDLLTKIIGFYFQNQTAMTDSLIVKINNRVQSVANELSQFKNLNNQINIAEAQARSLGVFNSFLFPNLLDDSFRAALTTRLDGLQSRTNGIQQQRGPDCCRFDQRRSRSWKFWKTQRYCGLHNPTRHQQELQKTLYSALRGQVQATLNNIFPRVTNILIQCRSILSRQGPSIVEKYYELKMKVAQLQSAVPQSMINQVINRIQERKNAANNLNSRIACGSRDNLVAYINELQGLTDFINSFIHRYNEVRQASNSAISQFSDTVYSALVNNRVVIEDCNSFFSSYQKFQNSSRSLIQKLKKVSSEYGTKQLLDPANALQISMLYSQIKQNLNVLCESRDNIASIQSIRNTYRQRLQSVSGLSNPLMNPYLDQLRMFLNKGSTLFSTYQSTAFCSLKQDFEKHISTLMPDFQNFIILVRFYNKIEKIKSEAAQRTSKFENQIKKYSIQFYQLFNKEMYISFIKNVVKEAQSLQITVESMSVELSYLREQANELQIFQMSPAASIRQSIQTFSNQSSFLLSVNQMFVNIFQRKMKSLAVVQLLSFDIIAFIVSATAIQQHFNQSMIGFQQGGSTLLARFNNITQNFLDLSNLVSQAYLNKINNDLMSISTQLNSTLFPHIQTKMNAILSTFSSYSFTNLNLKQLSQVSFSKLREFEKLLGLCKDEIFANVTQVTNGILKLTQKLQIAGLNSIFQLSDQISENFYQFYNNFPNLLKDILNFETAVLKNFPKIFSFRVLLSEIQTNVQKKYNESVTAIAKSINQSSVYLSQNAQFYEKFKKSGVDRYLTQAKSALNAEFSQLWANANPGLQKIDAYLKQISNEMFEKMKQLNEAKEKIANIESSVKKRIENIKNGFREIKNKFFSIQSLIFMSLRGDLNETVAAHLRNISTQLDGIVDVEFKKIGELINSKLSEKFPILATLINQTNLGYKALRVLKNEGIKLITNGLQLIDKFMQDNVVQKVQKLKQGILYIKSNTNLANPQQRVQLYRKQLHNKNVPIVQFLQPIPTPIGVFFIQIDLNFTLSINAIIGIRKFRSIDFAVIVKPALILKIKFFYGIAYLLEFGMNVQGAVLDAQITPAVQFNNLLPYQLVGPIADMPQFTNQNQADVKMILDVTLMAVQVQANFYIKHIWLEIVWIQKQFCVRFLFFGFCISFRIPIGFKIVFKEHQTGVGFPGVPLLKTTLLDVTLAKWQY